MYWQGLDGEESTWELVSREWADASAILRVQLKGQKLRQTAVESCEDTVWIALVKILFSANLKCLTK